MTLIGRHPCRNLTSPETHPDTFLQLACRPMSDLLAACPAFNSILLISTSPILGRVDVRGWPVSRVLCSWPTAFPPRRPPTTKGVSQWWVQRILPESHRLSSLCPGWPTNLPPSLYTHPQLVFTIVFWEPLAFQCGLHSPSSIFYFVGPSSLWPQGLPGAVSAYHLLQVRLPRPNGPESPWIQATCRSPALQGRPVLPN